MEQNIDYKNRLFAVSVILVGLLSVFVLVKIFSEARAYRFIGSDNAQVATITVSGKGEASVAPDMANLTLSVIGQAKDVAGAQNQATTKANAVIDYLKKAGIAEKDIKSSYSLYPQYSQQSTPCAVSAPRGAMMMEIAPCMSATQSVIVGYEVRHTLQVTSHDLDKLGTLVAGVGKLGVSEINGPEFKVENEDEVKLTTRAEAIKDAEAKAGRLAKDLGVRLVRVISFNENGGPIYYAKGMMSEAYATDAAAAPVPNLPAGENKITSDVSITYEIR